jgi:beta-phosphoglucomutase
MQGATNPFIFGHSKFSPVSSEPPDPVVVLFTRFFNYHLFYFNMSIIKACIFDLDGVIVDTAKYHYQAWRRLANELGFDFTEKENEQLKGVSRKESLRLILQWGGVEKSPAEQEVLAAMKNEWYVELIKEMEPNEILPGVVPFLVAVKRAGLKIALGSASKNARTILQKVSLSNFFTVIIDGNEVQHSKPDPEVFLKAAEALGVQPTECLVFEDAEKGIEAALNGDFFAIGVGDAKILQAAHLVIPSLGQQNIQAIIEGLTTSKPQ